MLLYLRGTKQHQASLKALGLRAPTSLRVFGGAFSCVRDRLIMKLINTRQMNKDDIEEAKTEIQVRSSLVLVPEALSRVVGRAAKENYFVFVAGPTRSLVRGS